MLIFSNKIKRHFAHRSVSKLPSHKSSKPVEEKALCKKKTSSDITKHNAKQLGFLFGANFIVKVGR